MPLSAGARLGPYEIVAPLGSGGMGEVYRARDTRLDRVVAIKVLPEGLAVPGQAAPSTRGFVDEGLRTRIQTKRVRVTSSTRFWRVPRCHWTRIGLW
jgi:serine/threonine protein kinase